MFMLWIFVLIFMPFLLLGYVFGYLYNYSLFIHVKSPFFTAYMFTINQYYFNLDV
jgi:hypothetical protein